MSVPTQLGVGRDDLEGAEEGTKDSVFVGDSEGTFDGKLVGAEDLRFQF